MPFAKTVTGLRRPVLALGILALLASCAATPAFGPGSPRDGAGEPVNPTFGTPLPGTPPESGG